MGDTHSMMLDEYPVQKTEEEWKAQLTASEYRVLRKGGTEASGAGEFCAYFPKTGYFRCRGCKFPLYAADSKFKDCGWDAYDKCFYTNDRCHVGLRGSRSRAEAACNDCGSHLGHTFFGEGHTETNERHCINSICVEHVKEAAPSSITAESPVKLDFNNPGGFDAAAQAAAAAAAQASPQAKV